MTRTFSAIIAGSTLLLTATTAHSELLSSQEIRSFIGGKKVLLQTRYGIDFPMYYRSNGQVTGDGEGTGLGKFFAPKETGRWWTTGNNMCQQFPTWYDGRKICFEIQRTGSNTMIWKREDGASGTAYVAG